MRFVRAVGLPTELYTVLCQPRYTYEYDLNNNKGAPFVVSNYAYLHTTLHITPSSTDPVLCGGVSHSQLCYEEHGSIPEKGRPLKVTYTFQPVP